MSEPRKKPNSAGTPPSNGDDGRDDAESWVAVGEIAGAFGIRGELKVVPLTDFPERFERTPTIYLGKQRTPVRVLEARLHKQHVLLRLDGIADVEVAERLRGETLWIPASQLTPLPDDQFYIHDLIGMRVRHVNGADLGTVAEVLSTPGNDLFVISMPDGREVLLPAVKAFVPSIDRNARLLTVDPIPGLFDDAADEAK
ncbi:MAG: ribosome maturation factor RimM [Ktedonobacterales bacterium]